MPASPANSYSETRDQTGWLYIAMKPMPRMRSTMSRSTAAPFHSLK